MLKDYSAPVRRLLYTAINPMASLPWSQAYTLKLVSVSYTHACLCRLLHCWTKLSSEKLLSFKCLYSFHMCFNFQLRLWFSCEHVSLWCLKWNNPVSSQGTFLLWKWLHIHNTSIQIFRQTSHEVFFLPQQWNRFGLYTDLTLKNHNFQNLM